MYETWQQLLVQIDEDGIAVVTINRPKKLNALNYLLLEELGDLFDRLQKDSAIRGVILTGAGEKAFVAGADITELNQLNRERGEKLARKGQDVFTSIANSAVPVIAAVNGYALGGGMELALTCHLRIASQQAVFGLPEVSLGLIPGFGGTQRLVPLVGAGHALELTLSGERIDAARAEYIGLVNRVVPHADVVSEAKKLMQRIIRNAPLAIGKTILAIQQAGTPDGYDTEARFFGELCDSEDFREGSNAFLEKRKPQFRGY